MEFVIGMFVGALLFYVFVDRKKPSGMFIIDLANPEEETCRLVWDESLDEICMKKSVVLNIKTIFDDSLN